MRKNKNGGFVQMKKVYLLILSIILIYIINIFAIPQKKYAVVDLKGIDIEIQKAKIVTNSLRSRLLRDSKGQVVPPAMMKQILSSKSIILEPSDDITYLSQVGEALNVEKVIGGTLVKSGSSIILNIIVVDPKKKVKIGEITKETNEFSQIMGSVIPEVVNNILNESYNKIEDPKQPKLEKITININTNPEGALVYINGNKVGTTPLKYTGKENDMLDIKIEKEGYNTLTTSIMITKHQKEFSFDLTPKVVEKEKTLNSPTSTTSNTILNDTTNFEGTGNLILSSDPEGAAAYLDGNYIGVTNLLYEAPAGKHTLELKLEGYRDTTLQIIIYPNQNNIIEVPLYAAQVAEEFKEEVEGNKNVKLITQISLGLITLGTIGYGIKVNKDIEDTYNEYKIEKDKEKVSQLHDTIENYILLRNTLYLIGGLSGVGVVLTFTIW